MHRKKKPFKKIDRSKIAIKLTPDDLSYLKRLVETGTQRVRTVTRARILLLSHHGATNVEIMKALGCSHTAIADVRTRYENRGKNVKEAVIDAPRSGQPKKILPKHEAFVVATACTAPPAGHAHWTLDALKNELLKTYKQLRTVSDERIRQILLSHELKPWREKNVVPAQTHGPLS